MENRLYTPTGLWTPEMRARALAGDLEMCTRLMNLATYDRAGITALYSLPHKRKVYEATYVETRDPDEDDSPTTYSFYAPSDALAWWFLDLVMTRRPEDLCEVITTFREVVPAKLPESNQTA